MKKVMEYGVAIVGGTLVGALICVAIYVVYKRVMYNEFKRGLMTGVRYYAKHGEFPSMWHWEHAFYDDKFNIDTVLIPNRIKEAEEELAWKAEIYKEMGIDTNWLPYHYHYNAHPDSVVILGDPTWPGSQDITLPDNSIQITDSSGVGSDESITTYQNSIQ